MEYCSLKKEKFTEQQSQHCPIYVFKILMTRYMSYRLHGEEELDLFFLK